MWSQITSAFLVAGLLLVAAGVIAWRTQLARWTPMVWMRVADGRIAHAIWKVELHANRSRVDSAGRCGPWPVDKLVCDERAMRCPVCVRAVADIENGVVG